MIGTRILAAGALWLALLLPAPPAGASWGGPGAGGGRGYSKATSLPTVAAPSATVANRSATVSWSAPSGAPPSSGYLVKRYNASGQIGTIGSACSGTVSALSCVESGIPAGSWRYTVTLAKGNWRGAESAQSAPVSVDPAALSLITTTVNSFPTTLSGQISRFLPGQGVSFRLDDPTSGTLLAGSISPAPVQASGNATVSVTVPPGTANGAHTVYAVGSGGDQANASIAVTVPKVTAAAIAKSAGGDDAFVKQGGTYYAYANVSGSGSPPAGLATLTADVSSLTVGANGVPLSFGSYSVAGQSYNYRSAQQTAASSLAAGVKSYGVKLTDAGGTQTTTTYSVTVDNTAPSAAGVQTANVFGGTVGRAEPGDQITLTYSEPIDASSVLAGWNGSSTPVVVRLLDGSPDSVQIWNATNLTQVSLGAVALGRNDFTTANVTFGASGTPSTMVRSAATITITLGTPLGAVSTAGGKGTLSWTPSAAATDYAGNASTTTTRNETGTKDADF